MEEAETEVMEAEDSAVIPTVIHFQRLILQNGVLLHGKHSILHLCIHSISEHGKNFWLLWPMIFPVRSAEHIMLNGIVTIRYK
jgi:hypothetical protein